MDQDFREVSSRSRSKDPGLIGQVCSLPCMMLGGSGVVSFKSTACEYEENRRSHLFLWEKAGGGSELYVVV